MGLHQLHKRAEWYPLPDNERTSLQRLAARTGGLATPSNAISIVGAAVTLSGLTLFYQQHLMAGLILVGAGRICDILDGHIARRTHTTSPIGEAIDAGLDKVVVIVGCALLMAVQVLPVALGAILLTLQLTIAGLAVAVRHDGTGLHPTRLGKYAMFGLWVSIGLFMAAHLLDSHSLARPLFITGAVLLSVVILANFESLRQYLRAARQKHLTKQ